jgi:hypothetical protein
MHYTLYYTLHYTLYTVHCTLYTIHSHTHTLHSTLYTIHYTHQRRAGEIIAEAKLRKEAAKEAEDTEHPALAKLQDLVQDDKITIEEYQVTR